MSRLLEVGKVVRPHGLKGQVMVELSTNVAERVAPGSTLEGPEGRLTVKRSSAAGASGGRQRWIVSFEEIVSREQAEGIREAVLRAEPVEGGDALWVHQLVGSDVFTSDGEQIGKVDCVQANPASDLLVLEDGRLIPLHFVTGTAPGRLTVEVPEGLLDL